MIPGTRDQATLATDQPTPPPAHWLVSVVEEIGLAGAAEVQLDRHAPTGASWNAIRRACAVSEAELARIVAARFNLPLADLSRADSRALRLIPQKVAKRFGIMPMKEDAQTITVATSDPRDLEMEEAVRFASGRQPRFEVATPTELAEVIDSTYSPGQVIETLLDGLEDGHAEDVRIVDAHGPEVVDSRGVESGPVVRLTNLILRRAAKEGASDVHIEPSAQGGVVRFRIDGVLRPQMRMPVQALARVVSRIKIMAKLDIADRLRPQDGRARVQVEERIYDMRVSTVPTRESEKMVIRMLDPQSTMRLRDLSFPSFVVERFRRLLGHRSGIVLVTGPTGSGKTTTVYAAITEIANGETNIMIVDDDPLNRLLVRHLLEKSGFRVSEAIDAGSALEQLRPERGADVSLIVLDLLMPGIGGEELLVRLKNTVATAGIPVMVLTGSEGKEAEARLIDLGADDYIEKPLDRERFLARVKATLRRASQ
jgi:type IV pilus assembly protein PilB